ncbi:MAG: hypothetical protein MK202_02300 [Tenacibaculum sp.]|nr:hypothetical protein [Tenacibaculum sp.]
MKKIETQRHLIKFYGTIFFGFLPIVGLGSLMIFIGFNNEMKNESDNEHIITSIFGSLFCLLAIWMVYLYWKSSPKIIINKNSIKIGKETFNLNSIQDVILTGKMPLRFILDHPMEGTAILFKDGTEKILFDDMYSNSYLVKSFLEQVIVKKQEFKINSPKEINKNKLQFESTEKFKGNQFTTSRGISFWGIIVFMTFIFTANGLILKLGGFIFFSLVITFWIVLHYWLLHYFEMTKKFLIIKNHIFIWKLKIYDLSDIKEVVFETQSNRPNCLRVITNNFKNKLYPAGTLSDKTWLEMKKRLESRGVHVRNECIYE